MTDFAATCPQELKQLKPYFARAKEFESRNPQVAYLCRQYAAQIGIELLQKFDAATKSTLTPFLIALMDELEREKQDPAKSAENGKEVLLKNAYLIFKRADDRERLGNADKACIAMFTTASHLMEASKQFGEWDPDVAQKHKYARYTASQINKALATGVPYVSPNAPTEEDLDTLMEDLAPQDMRPPAPAVHVDPTPVAPPPPPPAPPGPADIEELLRQMDSGSGSPTSQGGLPSASPTDEMEARLASHFEASQHNTQPPPPPAAVDPASVLAGLTGGAAAAPQPPPLPAGVADSFLQREVERVEVENLRLKAELDARTREVETARAEAEKYKKATEQLLAQVRSAGGAAAGAGGGIAHPVAGFEPSLNEIMEAQKFAKFVISALQFNDTHSARDNLNKCMAKVNGHPL